MTTEPAFIKIFEELINFQEDPPMNRVPTNQDAQDRKSLLQNIRDSLEKNVGNRDVYEEHVRQLTQLMNTIVNLNHSNPWMREQYVRYELRYDKFILQMKQVILTVRVQIILLELS